MVGKLDTKEVILKNSSPIPAKFRITNEGLSDFKDNVYAVYPQEGEIPAKSSFELKINYLPLICNVSNLSRFRVHCEGGNELKIACRGYSSPFDVKLNTRSINFGEIKLESSLSRALTIVNSSELETTYQFFCD